VGRQPGHDPAGAKILVSDEGLHGWAYETLTRDHLRVQLVEQDPQDIHFRARNSTAC